MDLTLFIVILILILGMIYGINIIMDLKNDIKKITGNKDETDEYDMKSMIDKFKYGLEYLKNFL